MMKAQPEVSSDKAAAAANLRACMIVVVSDEGDLEWVKFALFGGKVWKTRKSWRRSKYSDPSSQAAVSPSRHAVDRYQAASF
jgi:hypothetical protein